MPYTITPAGNILAISEREVGVGATIRFTGFSSCIGVIALDGANLTAVHLSLRAADDTPFKLAAANKALAALGDTYSKALIMGCVDVWEDPATGVTQGYQFLKSNLNNFSRLNLAEGAYGATVNGTAIKLLHPPHYT